MRELIRDPQRLEHMLEAIIDLDTFLAEKTLMDLKRDKVLFYGCAKCVEIIGEAASKLSHEFISTHPDTQWKPIIGMRHILVHGYYQMEAEEIWDIRKEDLPLLKSQIQDYLKEFDD